jgi:hypothetical protein
MAEHALPFGLLLALSGALAPALIPVTLIAAFGLLVGCILVGSIGAGMRAVLAAVGAVLVAAVLLFPWTLEFLLPGANWATFTGIDLPPERGLGVGALMRFESGPVGGAPLGWAIAIAATLVLVIGRGWRFTWAARLWTLAVTCWLVTWMGGQGWLPVPLPSVEVMLAPAAAALALAVALGLVAFEVDLRGFQFGVRQVASVVAAGAVVLATLPVLGAAVDGRWNLPARDVGGLLSWMPEQERSGAFRVLWLGDPEALPLQGWRLDTGLAYGTSRNGPPDATVLWPGSSEGPTQLLADAVNLARGGRATLKYHTSPARYIAILVELALWLAAIRALREQRRRRRNA